jgi:uncharacterized membrane protein YagU involved in acid resistance
MPTENISEFARPKAFETILLGGAIAGLLDGIDAVVFYYLAFGVTPTLLFQNIASGLLGRKSFGEGWYTVVLGIALQFIIAIGAAAVFFMASLILPALFRKPAIFGPAFGVLVYVVMHYIVVPLSAVAKRTIPVTTAEFVDQILSHTIFVGLPIALMAKRSARAR